ncbi:hypothetical protein AVEN_64433-1 [Araneus ventricosus]|uniref:Uncharacterized protein n=1 Tax=Araneus ventricosus TaxID=182803 RepID=A0A4Y2RE04_ARAVE|nr:hypothetical protein AVEN_64433-1 [Araneus ventricosus]
MSCLTPHPLSEGGGIATSSNGSSRGPCGLRGRKSSGSRSGGSNLDVINQSTLCLLCWIWNHLVALPSGPEDTADRHLYREKLGQELFLDFGSFPGCLLPVTKGQPQCIRCLMSILISGVHAERHLYREKLGQELFLDFGSFPGCLLPVTKGQPQCIRCLMSILISRSPCREANHDWMLLL